MSSWKKILIFVLLILMVLCFSSCQKTEDPNYESKYKQAVDMIAEGKYSEAASLLDNFGSYEEATKLSLYCRAIDTVEKGDYQSALTTFRNLSGFLDSDLMYSYYSAHAEMSLADDENHEPAEQYVKAADIFRMNPLFRDSKELADSCYKSAYEYAKKLISQKRYYQAISDFELLGDYLDSPILAKQAKADAYYNSGNLVEAWEIYRYLDEKYQTHASDYKAKYKAAVEKKENGEYAEAAIGFAELGDYEDSINLNIGCTYLHARTLMDNADYETAIGIFKDLNEYKDSADLVTECRYLQAKALMTAEKYEEAIAIFEDLEKYKDSALLIKQTNADMLFKEGKLADAWKIYAYLNDEYRVHDAEYEERYLTAADELKNQKYDDARSHYLELGGFKDSVKMAKKCLTDKAEAYVAEKQFAKAISIYTDLGDTGKVSECHYLLAQHFQKDGKYVLAATQYNQCIKYKDSALKHFQMGNKAYEAGLLQEALVIFESDPDTEAAKEMIYRIAMKASEKKEYAISTDAYRYVGVYKEAVLERMKDYYRWGNMLYDQGDYDGSANVFATLGDFSTAPVKVKQAGYSAAVAKMDAGEYAAAKEYLVSLGDFEDSRKLLRKCEYELATALYHAGEYQAALDAFTDNNLAGYEKANEIIDDCHYHLGLNAENQGRYLTAVNEFNNANGCQDSADHLLECTYLYAVSLKESGELSSAVDWFIKAEKHSMTIGQMESIIDYCEVTEQSENADYVRQALALIQADNALDASDFKKAVEFFGQITNTSISKDREKEAWFRYGKMLLATAKYDEAVEAFAAAEDYEDAKDCLKKAWNLLGNVELAAGNYERAREAYAGAENPEMVTVVWAAEANKLLEDGKYEEARKAYANAGRDEKIKEVWEAEAENYLAEYKFEEAKKAFSNAGNQERYDDVIFAEANLLMNRGMYKEAYDLFATIAYRDDVKNIFANNNEIGVFLLEQNDIVKFGEYEQDNNLKNGKEPIEWIVLDIQGNKALLLSRYGLDAKPYNEKSESVSWETCSIRKWLNGEFLSTAFSEENSAAILLTDVDNSDFQGFKKWKTSGGNNTKDRIFLLSYAEANKFLGVMYDDKNIKPRVQPTAYARAKGAYVSELYKTEDGNYTAHWWLRSPGNDMVHSAFVNTDGTLFAFNVQYNKAVIRPAFWIKLEDLLPDDQD